MSATTPPPLALFNSIRERLHAIYSEREKVVALEEKDAAENNPFCSKQPLFDARDAYDAAEEAAILAIIADVRAKAEG